MSPSSFWSKAWIWVAETASDQRCCGVLDKPVSLFFSLCASGSLSPLKELLNNLLYVQREASCNHLSLSGWDLTLTHSARQPPVTQTHKLNVQTQLWPRLFTFKQSTLLQMLHFLKCSSAVFICFFSPFPPSLFLVWLCSHHREYPAWFLFA